MFGSIPVNHLTVVVAGIVLLAAIIAAWHLISQWLDDRSERRRIQENIPLPDEIELQKEKQRSGTTGATSADD